MADSKTSQQEAHDILSAKVRRLGLLRIPMVVAMLLLGFHVTRTAVAHYRTYQASALLKNTSARNTAARNTTDKPSAPAARHDAEPKQSEPKQVVSASPNLAQMVLQAVGPDTNRLEPSGSTSDGAPPAESPAIALPEWADAISGAVVWMASRALRPPVLTSDNESNRPSAEEPAIIDLPIDVDLISIVNPLSSGIEINYMVNNDVFHLSPGQTHEMKNNEPVQVRYHRGGSLGDAIQLLTSGKYDFDVTDHGWDLVRRETRDAPEKSP